MKPKTRLEERGATFATCLAIPLAFPLYVIERMGRADRKTPMTDRLMQSAQTIGLPLCAP